MPNPVSDKYVIQSVVRAQRVLGAFRPNGELLRLRDVVERTGLGKALCFRLLHTLRRCGVLEKVDINRFRLVAAGPPRRYRIGYADFVPRDSFMLTVNAGLTEAAAQANIELIQVSNRNDPKVAVRNAHQLVRQSPDLVMEFQVDESVAPAVAAVFLEAGIPLIAIDIPHPGGTYFGADNYRAGLLAGRHLGKWAKAQWTSRPDEILLIEAPRTGSLVRSRTKGVLVGIQEILLGPAERCPVVSLDGEGQFRIVFECVRKHLRRSKAHRVLVGTVNDSSALGAVRAFQEAGRGECCAVVGQNAEPDARIELRQPQTPLVATVAHFPEKYGEALVRLALEILGGQAVPPALFVKHQVVTRENVDHLYPNDALLELAPSF